MSERMGSHEDPLRSTFTLTVNGVDVGYVESVSFDLVTENPQPTVGSMSIGGTLTVDLSPETIAKLRWLIAGPGSVVDRVEED